MGQGLFRTSRPTECVRTCASRLGWPTHSCPVSGPTALLTTPVTLRWRTREGDAAVPACVWRALAVCVTRSGAVPGHVGSHGSAAPGPLKAVRSKPPHSGGGVPFKAPVCAYVPTLRGCGPVVGCGKGGGGAGLTSASLAPAQRRDSTFWVLLGESRRPSPKNCWGLERPPPTPTPTCPANQARMGSGKGCA